MKRLTLYRFIAVNTLYIHAEITIYRAKLSNTYVKAKTMMFFGFATETTKRKKNFGNCQ
jgi:hypothetical protein